MISGENLTFCAADSNMYIGRIHPLIYCSSFFFPHSAFNFRNSHPCINLHFYRISLIYAWRAERVVLKNVRMFFLSGLLEEMVIQSCFYHAIEKRRKSWKKVGKEKGWDGRSRQWRWVPDFCSVWRENSAITHCFARIVPKGTSCRISGIE